MNKKASTEQFLILFIFIIIMLAGAGFLSASQGALSTDAYIQIFSKDVVFITEAAIGAPGNVMINYPFNLEKFKFTFGNGWVYIKDKSQKQGANSTIATDASVPIEVGKIGNKLIFLKTYNEIMLSGNSNTSMKKIMCTKPQPGKRMSEIKAVIDPGHGGADKGYVNYADATMYEADRAYVLAANIKPGFYTLGLTREKTQEKNLSARLSLINTDTDFVLSVHTGNDKNQIIAYVPFDNIESASLACHILDKIVADQYEVIEQTDGGFVGGGGRSGGGGATGGWPESTNSKTIAADTGEIIGIAIVPTSRMPILNKNAGKLAVMIEIGTIQGDKATNMLYKDTFKITEAISAGIEQYFDGSS